MKIAKINQTIAGEFAWEIRKKGTNELVRKQDYVPNMILNNFYSNLGDYNYPWNNYIIVGTGNSTPNESQTTLDNSVKYAKTFLSDQAGFYNTDTKILKVYNTFKASISHNQEVNLTELGFSRTGSSNPTVVTRALFKDSNGSPLTITLLTDEILIIYYRIWKTQDCSPKNYTLPFEVISRGSVVDSTNLNITSWFGVIEAGFGEPSYTIDPNYPNICKFKKSRVYNMDRFKPPFGLPIIRHEAPYYLYKELSDNFFNDNKYIVNSIRINSGINDMSYRTSSLVLDRFENDTQYYKHTINYKTGFGTFTQENNSVIYGIQFISAFGFLNVFFKRADNNLGIEKTGTQELKLEVEYGLKIIRGSLDTLKADLPPITF